MKLKLDENLPVRAAQRLREMGYDVDTVLEEGLGGAADTSVWEASQADGRFLVTQDLDFSDLRRFSPGTHHGVLLVRLEDREQPRVADYLASWFAAEPVGTWLGALVVASPRKIRVLRP